MVGLERLRALYAMSGHVISLSDVYKLIEDYGYRVGLPGHVVARTLDAEIATFLSSLDGGKILPTEKDVADFIAGKLRDQISSSSK